MDGKDKQCKCWNKLFWDGLEDNKKSLKISDVFEKGKVNFINMSR